MIMKRILSFVLSVIFFLFFAAFSFAVTFPKPVGYVNDFAGLYSTGFKTNLEDDLSVFEKETGAEISVVTIKTLSGNDIETYAVRLFEDWKIGKKGKDNGLLLLISKDDRKIRIEVGYGLEPYVTDGRAGEIIRNVMSPEFKAENYEGGTLAAVTQLKKYISDKDIAPPENSNPSKSDDGFWGILGIIFAFYVVITYLVSYLGRTKEIWPGAALGGVLGAIGGLAVAAFIGLILGATIFGLFGLFLDWILTKNYNVRKAKGLSTGFFHTWGGFSGGGRGRGGFGGFGGGSSGGGGASGGW